MQGEFSQAGRGAEQGCPGTGTLPCEKQHHIVSGLGFSFPGVTLSESLSLFFLEVALYCMWNLTPAVDVWSLDH